MIHGIGTDITETHRFLPWVADSAIIRRFFNSEELYTGAAENHSEGACQHYAVRFAAKEAFSKALGTGLFSFALRDIWIVKDTSGKPHIRLSASVQQKVDELCSCKDDEFVHIHVSLSHEKDYAIAFVVIETVSQKVEGVYVS
jgi:holo-[acyl-carrier protein] synthase